MLLPAGQKELAKTAVTLQVFEATTCTRLELEALIVGLTHLRHVIDASAPLPAIQVYTDCKTAAELTGRRERLEACNFVSKRSKKMLSNADLYQKLFLLFDQLQPEIIWVKGHVAKLTSSIEEIFKQVDQATRMELRRLAGVVMS